MLQERNSLYKHLGQEKYEELLNMLPKDISQSLISSSLIPYLSQKFPLPEQMPGEFQGREYKEVLESLLDVNAKRNLLDRFNSLRKLDPENPLLKFINIETEFTNRITNQQEEVINFSILSEESNSVISGLDKYYNELMNSKDPMIKAAAEDFFNAASLVLLSTNAQKTNKGLQKIILNNLTGLSYRIALIKALVNKEIELSIDDFADSIIANNAFYLKNIDAYALDDDLDEGSLFSKDYSEGIIHKSIDYYYTRFMPKYISIAY